jgi:hypothetical protein
MPDTNAGLPGRGLNYTDYSREFYGDLSPIQKPNQPFIYDLVTKEKLFLQGLPTEIAEAPDSEFVAIRTPGRNNPRYHYTGGEDVIPVSISFYCDHESRQDVISKVKWLQALTRNDGYAKGPHTILFCFGAMYKGSKCICTHAIPTYSNWNREYFMFPAVARVELTLKRVTDENRTRANILKYDT